MHADVGPNLPQTIQGLAPVRNLLLRCLTSTSCSSETCVRVKAAKASSIGPDTAISRARPRPTHPRDVLLAAPSPWGCRIHSGTQRNLLLLWIKHI